MTFKYVSDTVVEAYFQMGWMMTDRPDVYDVHNHHNIWLMMFPCECPVPILQKGKRP